MAMTVRRYVDTAIAEALETAALEIVSLPTGGWTFVVANGQPVSVRARIMNGDWLELAAPLKDLTHTDVDGGWPLLALNDRLSGVSRVGCSRAGLVEMRAEAFIGSDAWGLDERQRDRVDLTTRVRELCADFCSAIHSLQGPHYAPRHLGTDTVAQLSSGAMPPVAAGSSQLVRLCLEAGWPAVDRASGGASVTLDAGHSMYQARVLSGRGNAFGATVPLLDVVPTSAICRAAIGRLLLLLSTRVRLVKGVLFPARGANGAEGAGVAVACEPTHSVEAVDRALSALAVACHLAGREVRALSDEGLAQEYVAMFRAQHDASAATRPESPASVNEDEPRSGSFESNHTRDAITKSFTQEDRPCLQQM
jgi:hypothetical protein